MPEQKPRKRRLFELPEKKKLDLERAEEPDMKPSGDAGYENTDKKDADVPAEGAPLKDKITKSIIRLLKKKGPPARSEP